MTSREHDPVERLHENLLERKKQTAIFWLLNQDEGGSFRRKFLPLEVVISNKGIIRMEEQRHLSLIPL